MPWINKLVNTFGSSIKPMITPAQAREKRTDNRTELNTVKIGLTDGCISCTAKLKNISTKGVCLSDIPKNLYNNLDSLTLFGPDQEGIPTVQIYPKWNSTHGDRKTIGASIDNPTENWLRFIQLSNKNIPEKTT